MIIEPQEIPGCFLIHPEPMVDDRGFFARVFSVEEFAVVGMVTEIAQINLARSETAGTLRGIHWQAPPFEEAKLVRCVRGSVFDVCVDLRPGSGTWGRSVGVELSSQNHLALYVPPGCGHGYLSLEEGSEVIYSTSAPYMPDAERGARWDDPAFDIDWPITEGPTLSEKDSTWPDLS